jgi:CHAT domain-containing protein
VPAWRVAPSADELVSEISRLADDPARRRFFDRRRRLVTEKFVRQLIEAVVPRGRADIQGALRLAETGVLLARKLRKKEVLALSLRSKANALNLAGQNQFAVGVYGEALKLFEQLGNDQEIGRTLSASLQALILLGEYDRAIRSADRAREIFTRLGDQRRLARLDNNVGNIYHRQDRFEEALRFYQRSYETLLPNGDSEELAIALNNAAVCLISLNDFPRALATYEQIRNYCSANKLPLLRSQAEYNIAYLYYLRGEYSRGIELLRAAREHSVGIGDEYVAALCAVDLSEIYLELNLSVDALEGARDSAARFQKLGMGYEEAKALANQAIALSQIGKPVQSLDLFGQARAKFVAENNRVWPSLIDLYEALVLFNEGRLFEARRLCVEAAEFFDKSQLVGKSVLCHLLLARMALRSGNLDEAQKECSGSLERLSALDSPVLRYQGEFLHGQILQAAENRPAAYGAFRRAREVLEALRSSVRGEELKISFMQNRLEVYESLVELGLGGNGDSVPPEETLDYIELAKSRTLAELLMHPRGALPREAGGQSELVRKIRDMREELNWYYRRIEIEQLRAAERSSETVKQLQERARSHENELVRVLRELPSGETDLVGGNDPDSAGASLEHIREALPEGAVLLEYFSVRDHFIAAVLTPDSLEFVPTTPISRVANLVRMLRFQISKFALGAGYARAFGKAMLEATQSHLDQLYSELIEPIRARLEGRHLIVAPHGLLHYIPFHALYDGRQYLTDHFTISYAPSGRIFALCQRKQRKGSGPPLVIGVPDNRAPRIEEEARSVAAILPGSQLVIGAERGEQALRDEGQNSRLVHIATHGHFRHDNPMFSGLRLGRAYLSLYDLYQLRMDADLVTLSGCSTGLSVVAAGDELLGLIRGLLYAGARSLLLSLWDVHDQTTTELITSFYRHLAAGFPKAASIQKTMWNIREIHPHPYYWAPFIVTGAI